MGNKMKKLVLTGLLLNTSIAFAGIINEHTTPIGAANGVGFERIESGEIPNTSPKFVQPSARTSSYQAKVNHNIRIDSEHGFMIQNFTSQKQRYHFKYEC